jgi:hypothetical protein
MRGQEREGGRNKPFCGSGSPAVAGGPEGQAPECAETAEAAPEDEVTGAIAAVTDDVPPPPEAKPESGPVKPAAGPEPKTSKSASRSAKRALKREVDRLRRLFNE